MRYEDLVTEPEPHLRGLCEFLGERYHAAMLEPARVASVAVLEHKTWHARTHQPIDPQRVGRWQDDLTPAEVSLSEAVLGARLRYHGYETSGAPAPPLRHRLRYERVALRHRLAPLKRSAIRVWDRLPLAPTIAA